MRFFFLFIHIFSTARRHVTPAKIMTNANANVNVNNQSANEVKARSLKCLANDAAKAEMFSLKGATNAVKNAYDADKERKDTRAYIEGLGYSAQMFKQLNWQDLQQYATTKSGRFSTWAVLNALKAKSDAEDLKGVRKAIEERKAERAAAKAAKERIEARKRAEREAKAEEKAKAAQAAKDAKVIEQGLQKANARDHKAA